MSGGGGAVAYNAAVVSGERKQVTAGGLHVIAPLCLAMKNGNTAVVSGERKQVTAGGTGGLHYIDASMPGNEEEKGCSGDW